MKQIHLEDYGDGVIEFDGMEADTLKLIKETIGRDEVVEEVITEDVWKKSGELTVEVKGGDASKVVKLLFGWMDNKLVVIVYGDCRVEKA